MQGQISDERQPQFPENFDFLPFFLVLFSETQFRFVTRYYPIRFDENKWTATMCATHQSTQRSQRQILLQDWINKMQSIIFVFVHYFFLQNIDIIDSQHTVDSSVYNFINSFSMSINEYEMSFIQTSNCHWFIYTFLVAVLLCDFFSKIKTKNSLA